MIEINISDALPIVFLFDKIYNNAMFKILIKLHQFRFLKSISFLIIQLFLDYYSACYCILFVTFFQPTSYIFNGNIISGHSHVVPTRTVPRQLCSFTRVLTVVL